MLRPCREFKQNDPQIIQPLVAAMLLWDLSKRQSKGSGQNATNRNKHGKQHKTLVTSPIPPVNSGARIEFTLATRGAHDTPLLVDMVTQVINVPISHTCGTRCIHGQCALLNDPNVTKESDEVRNYVQDRTSINDSGTRPHLCQRAPHWFAPFPLQPQSCPINSQSPGNKFNLENAGRSTSVCMASLKKKNQQ